MFSPNIDSLHSLWFHPIIKEIVAVLTVKNYVVEEWNMSPSFLKLVPETRSYNTLKEVVGLLNSMNHFT